MPWRPHPGGMLTSLHPGAPSADEAAALLAGACQLDDAIDTLMQVRIELWRLVADAHWQSRAVEMLRASLLERVASVSDHCVAIETLRSACLRAMS